MKINKYIIYGILLFLIVLFSWMSGCSYGKHRVKCPEIKHDTIEIHDTITHTIIDSFPYYINILDTIIYRDTIYDKIDTNKILANYFAIYKYNRHWEDSLLSVNIIDEISRNTFVDSKFNYKILRPQSIITNIVDNTITFNNYINFGIGIPIKDIKYINLEANYIWNKGYVGVMYTPEIKSFGVKGGITLFKFKKKK